MGLFRALLLAATKLPLEKLLVKRSTPEVQLEKLRALTERRQASSPSELSKAPSNALSNNPDLSLQRFDTLKDPSLLENSNKVAVRNSVRTISNEETISYQKREASVSPWSFHPLGSSSQPHLMKLNKGLLKLFYHQCLPMSPI